MMRIFIMRMSQKDADGFTLLELLFALLIIGIALALGAAYFQPHTSELEITVSKLASALSHARVEAMLSRRRSGVEFVADKIYILKGDGNRSEILSLPPNTRIQINGKSLMQNKPVQITFGPLGYATENMIYVYTPDENWTIYAPSLSSPLFRKGYYSIEEIRKELL